MHYYPRYSSHYLAKTLHLTMVQDGAYSRLLDWYYTNERPIPHDSRYEIARARKKAERDAVDTVLAQYFVYQANKYTNGRAEKEITEGRRRITTAQANGKKGGRRPNNAHRDPPKEPSGLPAGLPNGQALQAPISKQEREQDARALELATATAVALQNAGCPDAHPHDPRLHQALADGITHAELVGLAGTKKGNGKGLAYLIRTVCGQRADAQSASGPTRPDSPTPPRDPEAEARAAQIRECEDAIIDARHCGTVTKIIDAAEMTRRIGTAQRSEEHTSELQ